MKPSVTIVLPTYERAVFLPEAIESALGQTRGDFVLSIGDNSSDDESERIVAGYDDPRIRYRRHPENLGQMGNWLWLIDDADTPFVASLHDDDVWTPRFLERMLPPIEADPTVSMVFADYQLMDERGCDLPAETEALSARSHRDRLPAGTLDLTYPEMLRLIAVWNAPQPAYCAVLRRDAVVATDFLPEIDPVYDIWLSYQIARRGERVAYVPGRLTRYRWHPGSSTATGWARPEDEIFARILTENPAAGEVLREIEQYWSWIRWGRAVRMMAGPETRRESRIEFRGAATACASPFQRCIATLAAQSDRNWDAFRRLRASVHRLRGETT
ncbi:MAG: glycosyltransferase [Microthrixaceae bacterium]